MVATTCIGSEFRNLNPQGAHDCLAEIKFGSWDIRDILSFFGNYSISKG